MPVFKVSLTIERDGTVLQGYPKIRTLSVLENQDFSYQKADDGEATTFTTLPITQLEELQFLLFEADQDLTLRLDGQTDAGIAIRAGGVLLLLDADIDAGASTNATVNNNSSAVAQITGIAGGGTSLLT